MDDTIKLGLWAIVGLIVLYVIYQVVTVLLAFLGWLIQTVIMLAIAAVILYVGYLILSSVVGGGGNTSTAGERERIFE